MPTQFGWRDIALAGRAVFECVQHRSASLVLAFVGGRRMPARTFC